MADGVTVVAGIPIPSTSPFFLAGVGAHVALGLAAVATGLAAMLMRKGPGRHPLFGTLYVWSLGGAFLTAVVLAVVRWPDDNILLLLGSLAFAAALFGRWARQRRRPGWARRHVAGMGGSYIVLLTAFYVDNGKSLPVWRDLGPLAWWLAPSLVGLPLFAWALLRHPVVRSSPATSET